ncbi:hypothetical protein BJY04DRAFT_220433 [Aspergillus karnatakaensis]|uniref:uncharacterized protein n=1 Tax=Aspergillus karnatakaensis TaxID=1810916 RepID=UPI003CCD27A8
MRFTWITITALLGSALAAPTPETNASFEELEKRGEGIGECTAACNLACMGIPDIRLRGICYGACFPACIASAENGGEVPVSEINGTVASIISEDGSETEEDKA